MPVDLSPQAKVPSFTLSTALTILSPALHLCVHRLAQGATKVVAGIPEKLIPS
jgi:hypothetical protein